MTIKNRTRVTEVVEEKDVTTCDICGIDETIADLQRVVGNPRIEQEYMIYEDGEIRSFDTRQEAAEYARQNLLDEDHPDNAVDHHLSQQDYQPHTRTWVEGDFKATCCDHCKETLLSIYDGPDEQE